MASRLGRYAVTGEADARRAIRAAAIELAVAVVATLLLWPFPLIRLTLGIPWAVHGPLIVVGILVVYVAYLAVSVRLWGRSPAMYFLDLGLTGASRPFPFGRGLRWAAGWAVAVVPALLGARSLGHPREGLPARFSGLDTAETAPSDD
jgi:hypothetical protein